MLFKWIKKITKFLNFLLYYFIKFIKIRMQLKRGDKND